MCTRKEAPNDRGISPRCWFCTPAALENNLIGTATLQLKKYFPNGVGTVATYSTPPVKQLQLLAIRVLKTHPYDKQMLVLHDGPRENN